MLAGHTGRDLLCSRPSMKSAGVLALAILAGLALADLAIATLAVRSPAAAGAVLAGDIERVRARNTLGKQGQSCVRAAELAGG